MPDRAAISHRFLAYWTHLPPKELAKVFDVTPATVFQWLSGERYVPWNHVKYLADTEGILLDWLFEGRGPKRSKYKPCREFRPLNRHSINQRFLSLFPDMSQKALGTLLGVAPVAVFRWRHDLRQVPWEKLQYVVDNKAVTWEWLLGEA